MGAAEGCPQQPLKPCTESDRPTASPSVQLLACPSFLPSSLHECDPVLHCGQKPGVHNRTETQRWPLSRALSTSREGSNTGQRPTAHAGVYSPRANCGPKTTQARGQTQPAQPTPAHTTPRETNDKQHARAAGSTNQAEHTGREGEPSWAPEPHAARQHNARQTTTANTPPPIPLAGAGRRGTV